MDYYQPNYNQSYTPPKNSALASASCVIGICSLILLCTGILPVPLGALGIMLAVISKRGKHMSQAAKTGCVLSAVGLVTGLVVTIALYFFALFSGIYKAMDSIDPEELQNMNQDEYMDQIMESIYGSDYKEMFEKYGIDYDRLLDSIEQ